MKAVLLSIKPQHCLEIANSRKTIELRKSKPKLQVSFKVYIYCTKGKTLYSNSAGEIRITNPGREKALQHHTIFNGKVVGEFICDSIESYEYNKNTTLYLSTLKKYDSF